MHPNAFIRPDSTDFPLTPWSQPRGGTSSTLGAAFNILCTVVGTGLLNLPAGFAQSGWVGVPFFVVMCTMAGYTACVLIKCFDYIGTRHHATGEAPSDLTEGDAASAPKRETYGDIGQAAYGACGRWFVTVQMHLTLVMVATIYHLLAAINLRNLFPQLSQPAAVMLVAATVFGYVLCVLLTH
jgi:amino acid permease